MTYCNYIGIVVFITVVVFHFLPYHIIVFFITVLAGHCVSSNVAVITAVNTSFKLLIRTSSFSLLLKWFPQPPKCCLPDALYIVPATITAVLY
jgi:hypothetical protein